MIKISEILNKPHVVVICHSRRQGGIIGQLLSQSVRKHKFADNDFFPDRTFFIGREGNGSRIEWNHTYWENWVANGENYPTYDFNDIDFELSFLPEEFVVNCKNRTECVEAQKLLWGMYILATHGIISIPNGKDKYLIMMRYLTDGKMQIYQSFLSHNSNN